MILFCFIPFVHAKMVDKDNIVFASMQVKITALVATNVVDKLVQTLSYNFLYLCSVSNITILHGKNI